MTEPDIQHLWLCRPQESATPGATSPMVVKQLSQETSLSSLLELASGPLGAAAAPEVLLPLLP